MDIKKFAPCLFVALLALHVCQHQSRAQQARARASQKLPAQQQSIITAQKFGAAQKSYVEGELLVQFVDEKTMQAARTLHARTGATAVREFTEFGNWQQVKLPKGLSVEAALKRYRTAPGVDAQGHDKATNGIDDDGDGYVDDVYGIDTANSDADPLDDFGHGTHVAGIVGAVGNNGLGVAGVNWSVQLMAVKMFDASGNG